MTDREIIRREVERMMAEEMAIYKESLKDGSSDVSGAPVAYTRLQMLLAFIDFMPEEKCLSWTEEAEQKIRERLEDDYRQSNNMVNMASRSDKPFKYGTEIIMIKESAESIIKLIKKEIGV